MKTKMAVVFLVAAVLLTAVGCGKQGGTSGTKKQAAAPSKGQPGTASTQPPTTVGGQQPTTGTAQQPTKAGEANQPASARAGAQQGGVTTVAADISTQAYVQQSQQRLNLLQKDMDTLQTRIGTLSPESQKKAQQLQQRFQQNLTQAQAALDKVKTASGDALKDAKAAADKALNEAQATNKELQSLVGSPTPGTK